MLRAFCEKHDDDGTQDIVRNRCNQTTIRPSQTWFSLAITPWNYRVWVFFLVERSFSPSWRKARRKSRLVDQIEHHFSRNGSRGDSLAVASIWITVPLWKRCSDLHSRQPARMRMMRRFRVTRSRMHVAWIITRVMRTWEDCIPMTRPPDAGCPSTSGRRFENKEKSLVRCSAGILIVSYVARITPLFRAAG